MKLLLLLSFICILFTGCLSSYPMNLSKDEYNMLSLQEKIELKEKQAKLNNKRNIEALKNKRQKEKYEYELALQESKRVEHLYEHSTEELFVSFSHGSFKQLPKGYFIAPFSIVPYEVKKIPVYSKNSTYKQFDLWVSFQNEALYVGIKPPKSFKHLKSFVYSDMQKLITKSYHKPIVIPRSRKWYREYTYKISFNNQIEAKDLHITLYLIR